MSDWRSSLRNGIINRSSRRQNRQLATVWRDSRMLSGRRLMLAEDYFQAQNDERKNYCIIESIWYFEYSGQKSAQLSNFLRKNCPKVPEISKTWITRIMKRIRRARESPRKHHDSHLLVRTISFLLTVELPAAADILESFNRYLSLLFLNSENWLFVFLMAEWNNKGATMRDDALWRYFYRREMPFVVIF